MIAAFLLRVLAPQLDAGAYALWLILAAGRLAARLRRARCCAWTPLLLAPRVDGKEH
jgi:hypothetical protein